MREIDVVSSSKIDAFFVRHTSVSSSSKTAARLLRPIIESSSRCLVREEEISSPSKVEDEDVYLEDFRTVAAVEAVEICSPRSVRTEKSWFRKKNPHWSGICSTIIVTPIIGID